MIEIDPKTGEELDPGCYMMGSEPMGLCPAESKCPSCARVRERREGKVYVAMRFPETDWRLVDPEPTNDITADLLIVTGKAIGLGTVRGMVEFRKL